MAELEITLLKEQEPEKAIILDNEPMSNDAYEDGYKLGYDEGYNKAESENPFYYIKDMSFTFSGRTFAPEKSNVVIRVLDCAKWNLPFGQLSGIKTLKIICDTPNLTVGFAQLVRESADLELLDLSEFKCYPTTIAYFALYTKKLKTISGALDLSQCTATTSAFTGANALEDIEFVPNTIPISISFSYSQNLSDKSRQSIIDGLADLTGSATQTVTFHKTVKDKLTDSQIATATQKNWTIA